MSDYTYTSDFGSKDSKNTGDPDKVIKGADFETEFTALQTAVNSKADTSAPTFTGSVTIPTAAITTLQLGGTSVTATAEQLNAVNDKAPKASPTFTGTVSLGDDVKAVFGTGSDLEIFHDGTDSIISDNGTGTLKLRQGLNDRLSLKTGGVTVHGEVAATTGDFGSTETGTLRVETSQTILSGGAVGTAGDITWDSNYLYVCVATNTWKRVSLSDVPGAVV